MPTNTEVYTFELGMLATNAYLAADPERGQAILIDAPEGVQAAVGPLLNERAWQLTALVLTHGHYDHLGGAAELLGAHAVPVHAHPDDRAWIENPMRQEAFMPPGMHVDGVSIDHKLEQGDAVELLGLAWEVRHVPGHSPGNILLYEPGGKVAFVGDAIFAGSVGRPDLPLGNWEVLEESIRRQIYTLPDDTTLYPGHGPATTVGQEKSSNPYVQG